MIDLAFKSTWLEIPDELPGFSFVSLTLVDLDYARGSRKISHDLPAWTASSDVISKTQLVPLHVLPIVIFHLIF